MKFPGVGKSLHDMFVWEEISAIHAVGFDGAGLLTAGGTVDEFGPDLAIHGSIPGIDLEDFRFQMIVGEPEVVPEQFPHRLAGEGEFLQFLFGVVFFAERLSTLAEAISAAVLALSIW